MKFNIGDKFNYKGMECEVIYVNQSIAWLAPCHDVRLDHGNYYKNCSVGRIDEEHVDVAGLPAFPLLNQESMAI